MFSDISGPGDATHPPASLIQTAQLLAAAVSMVTRRSVEVQGGSEWLEETAAISHTASLTNPTRSPPFICSEKQGSQRRLILYPQTTAPISAIWVIF